MGINRGEQKKEEKEVAKDCEHSSIDTGQRKEWCSSWKGWEKKALKRCSSQITMQFKSLSNLPSYY